jgi:adenine phosphoribosyltransferase
MTYKYEHLVRNINDYPKEGIIFKDITPLLQDKRAFQEIIEEMASVAEELNANYIAGIDARGFIFGGALAQRIKSGFIPIRKPGKLPAETYQQTYELEYGTDTLEIHADAASPGDRVLVIDDLLATGGTAEAAIKLIRQTGAEAVGLCVLIELEFLKGKEKLHGIPLHSLLKNP